MKRISVLVILLIAALSACDLAPVYVGPVPICSTYADADAWIHDNIVYEADDRLAPIQETLETKVGDCKDYAVLFLAMVYQNQGIKGVMRFYRTPYGDHVTAVLPGYEFGYIPGSRASGKDLSYEGAMRLQGHSGPIYR
jgi:hypothetical protein